MPVPISFYPLRDSKLDGFEHKIYYILVILIVISIKYTDLMIMMLNDFLFSKMNGCDEIAITQIAINLVSNGKIIA